MTNNPETFVAYWGGYFDSPLTLDKIPDYVDVVVLAFGSPDIVDGKSVLITDFLCSKYSDDTIIGWVKQVQARGQKVMMSILDTPQTHWNVLNIPDFVSSLKAIAIDKWGMDGIDIDAESGMPSDVYEKCFIELVQEIRKSIGNKILTYTCYTGTSGPDGSILRATHCSIDWINLMGYFDDYETMILVYNDYSTIMGDNITIGVKAGKEFTHLDEVIKLCKWEPPRIDFEVVVIGRNYDENQDDKEISRVYLEKQKKGMMLWTLNRDYPSFTGQPDWTWSQTIHDNLPT